MSPVPLKRPHTGREELENVLGPAAESGAHGQGEARQGAGEGRFRGTGRLYAGEQGKGHSHMLAGHHSTFRRTWRLGGHEEEDIELGSGWGYGTSGPS